MCVPLRDQSGKVRYYLGAQLDITDLVVNCTEMSSLYKILQTAQSQDSNGPTNKEAKLGISGAQQLEELGQTLDPAEMDRLILQRTSHVVPTGHEVGLRGLRTIHKPSPALPLKETVPPPLGFYQNVRRIFEVYVRVRCISTDIYSTFLSVHTRLYGYYLPHLICDLQVPCNHVFSIELVAALEYEMI